MTKKSHYGGSAFSNPQPPTPKPEPLSLELEVGLYFFPHRGALDFHVIRQSVFVRRIRFTRDQGLQVAAARRRDAEAVRGDVFTRDLLFLVGDFRERDVADGPLVWL